MTTSTRIAIIGAGHSGICMGMKLKEAGIEDFVILEKGATLGGTWRDNTYPGASCDAPSFLYSFSFAQKTDWSRRFAWQPELLAYSVECAIKAGLMPHFLFRTEVVRLRFNEARNLLELTCTDGQTIEAKFVVTAVGQLHRPATPVIPGHESFDGMQFHSARWDHSVDLTGKRVAVIGNAASAVQFVPQIAPLLAQLTIFQRSANWLLTRRDKLYSPRLHRRMKRWPWLARLRHDFQWFFFGEMQLTPSRRRCAPCSGRRGSIRCCTCAARCGIRPCAPGWCPITRSAPSACCSTTTTTRP
jgi:cation diffusion facilitator CzcD-associated flavoprotein CzcO